MADEFHYAVIEQYGDRPPVLAKTRVTKKTEKTVFVEGGRASRWRRTMTHAELCNSAESAVASFRAHWKRQIEYATFMASAVIEEDKP